MILIPLSLLWVVCGVLSYGMVKNDWRHFLQKRFEIFFDRDKEGACWGFIIGGPVALIAALILCREGSWGLCFIMPLELCEEARELAKGQNRALAGPAYTSEGEAK